MTLRAVHVPVAVLLASITAALHGCGTDSGQVALRLSTDAPTEAPTGSPTVAPSVAPIRAPSVAPTQAPESAAELCTVGCSNCAAVQDNIRDEAITDDECAACVGTSQSWWPCYLDGVWSSDLCQCADGVPASTPATPTPITAGLSTPLPTLSPTTGGGVCTAVGPSCDFTPGEGISSWFTRDLFDEMFPNICSSSCRGCEMLQYECLIKATLLYPDFATSSSEGDNKRELAAWLGEMSQETTGGGCLLSQENEDGTCSCGPMWCDDSPGGGCAAWGLCFVEEAAGNTYCSASSEYPCTAGKEYTGRGPKQLSWNYNYGQFSEQFCGDKSVLLENPDWVASNPTLAWASSMWFWFTGGACLPGDSCKPSCHDVFLGKNEMCASDTSAGRQYGLGWATNVINGGLECGGAGLGKCDYRVHSRVRFYKHFCDILDVSPLADGWTEDDNLFCEDQSNYVSSPPLAC